LISSGPSRPESGFALLSPAVPARRSRCGFRICHALAPPFLFFVLVSIDKRVVPLRRDGTLREALRPSAQSHWPGVVGQCSHADAGLGLGLLGLLQRQQPRGPLPSEGLCFSPLPCAGQSPEAGSPLSATTTAPTTAFPRRANNANKVRVPAFSDAAASDRPGSHRTCAFLWTLTPHNTAQHDVRRLPYGGDMIAGRRS
jgi:hypothetical protein